MAINNENDFDDYMFSRLQRHVNWYSGREYNASGYIYICSGMVCVKSKNYI